jgi:prepilin-type N-terminal cleavage/methylation domain-containing protein
MSCTVSNVGLDVGRGRRARSGRASRRARGFSLIELLVVIAIIALVISIVLPALGGVRTQARIVASQTLSNTIKDAADAFARDNDRMPGYFSVEDMGSQANGGTFGMSAMENAILDLMGGVVVVGGPGGVQSSPTQVQNWGPTAPLRAANTAANRVVDTARIGVSSENNPTYLTVDPKYLVEQEAGQQFGVDGHVKINGASIPDIVDAFGTPLLLWVENRNALTPIEDADDFVAMDSGPSGDTVARFYWASNAAFLRADQLGAERRNQVPQGASDRDYSLISEPAAPLNASRVRDALVALVGSPAYPTDEAFAATGAPTPGSPQFVPLRGRGAFIVQSAGPDGYYLNVRDRGNRRLGGNLHYSWNFFTPGSTTTRHENDNGQPATIDIIPFFDDLVTQGGS